jgi:citrate synthase
VLDGGRQKSGTVAARLAASLGAAPTPTLVRAVNAALVLLADHELASSTMAVRIAASTRADPYDAVLAGLGAIGGPLHGAASQQVYRVLHEIERVGVERAVDDALRWQGMLPGFGHTVYTDGDPRFAVLRHLFDELATPRERQLLDSLVELAGAQRIPPPNVDLALAAITWATDLPPEAGQILFTVARISGWIAHYLEELGEQPLRYRARAVYAAPSSA